MLPDESKGEHRLKMVFRANIFTEKRNHMKSHPTQENPGEDCDKEDTDISPLDETRYIVLPKIDGLLPSIIAVKDPLFFPGPPEGEEMLNHDPK